MDKDKNRPADGADTLKDKNTGESNPLSPNELLFGKSEGVKEDEKTEKKSRSKRRIVILITALVLATALVVGVVAAAMRGAFSHLKESYISSPEDQAREVLKRYVASKIDSIEETDDPAVSDGTVRHEGTVGVSMSKECLDMLEEYGGISLDEEYFDLINELKLYYELYGDGDGVSLGVNLSEKGASFGAVGIYESEPDAIYLALPALSQALIGDKLGFDPDLPDLRTGGVSAEDKSELLSLCESVIDFATDRAGEVTRERVKVDHNGKTVKSDKLTFNIDRECALAVMDHLIKLTEERSELLDGIFLGGAEEVNELIESLRALVKGDFDALAELWIYKGELIGAYIKEEGSGLSFSRMASGDVLKLSFRLAGFPVSLSGSYADGNGDLALSVLGINVARIVVEGFSFKNGIPDGTVSISLSDAVTNLVTSYTDEGILSSLIGEGTAIGEMMGYEIRFAFEADKDDYLAQIKVHDPEGHFDLLTLSVDGSAAGDTEPYDCEGSDRYGLDEFGEYRETIVLSTELLDAVKALPDSLKELFDGKLMAIIDSGVYVLASSSWMEENFGGYLDRYLDPILDRVEDLIS